MSIVGAVGAEKSGRPVLAFLLLLTSFFESFSIVLDLWLCYVDLVWNQAQTLSS